MSDIILSAPIIDVFESWINNAVLKCQQPFLLAEILFFCKFQGRNEFFSSGGIGFYVLNFKR